MMFRREARLIVGGRDVTGLRIAFRATKTLDQKPNAIEISVWNLAPETRAAASEKGAAVMLTAGYEGVSRLLFAGDVDLVSHEREGADVVTRIQAGDGLAASRMGRIFEVFSPGATAADLVKRLGSQMQVAVGDALAKVRTDGLRAGADALSSGFVADGGLQGEFNRVARKLGYEWSVQDGSLQLLRPDETSGKEAIVLTPDTGLIGSPVMGIKEGASGKRNVLRCRSLLNGDFRPGRALHVEAEMIAGHFRVEAVQHEGDTHGNDWYSDLEAAPWSQTSG